MNKVIEHNVYLKVTPYLALFRFQEKVASSKTATRGKENQMLQALKTNHNLQPLPHPHTHSNSPTAADKKTPSIDAFDADVGMISL